MVMRCREWWPSVFSLVRRRALHLSPGPSPFRRGERGADNAVKILLFSVALAGCARVAPPAPRPVLVNVPIVTPIYCDVPALRPPPLAIASLTEDSPPADTIRDYAATVDVLKSAVRERDAILKGCEAPDEPNPRPLPAREGEQK